MPDYHVRWEIDLHADSPTDAAAKSLVIQRDSDSTATVFDVTDDTGTVERIDVRDQPNGKKRMTQHRRKPRSIQLSESDWTEIYYAVELKRLYVAADNRKNGRYADGVDLAAWRRQHERIIDALGSEGSRMYGSLTALIEAADRVVSGWGKSDLQFAVQDLDRALGPFGFGAPREKPN